MFGAGGLRLILELEKGLSLGTVPFPISPRKTREYWEAGDLEGSGRWEAKRGGVGGYFPIEGF
jgi:hypothetical protein